MATTEHEFTVNDDSGEPQRYTVRLHPAEEGVEILLPKTLKIVANSLGPLLDALGSAAGGDAEFDIMEVDLSTAGSGIGKALVGFADELVRAGGVAYCKEVLKYAVRVDKSTNTSVKAYQNFSTIYQGNYGELAKIMFLILKANFGPFLRASVANVNTSKMTSLLARLNG